MSKEINTINKLGISLEENENIVDIAYRTMGSDNRGMTLTFKNGIILSILTGEFAQSSEKQPFEIAFMDKRKGMDWMPEIFDLNDVGDDVLGYQNAHDVNYYIEQAIAYRT